MAPVTIGERIRDLRSERGVSQEALAEAAGVAQSAISKLERNQVDDPGVMMLSGIAGHLGVTLNELVGDARLPGAKRAAKSQSAAEASAPLDQAGALQRIAAILGEPPEGAELTPILPTLHALASEVAALRADLRETQSLAAQTSDRQSDAFVQLRDHEARLPPRVQRRRRRRAAGGESGA